ncbi:MAG: hypothetical protein ABI131_07395 [Nostocoides sp.]
MTIQHRDDLVDAPLRDEIALVGELVLAAASSSGHLSDADIDRVLGLGSEAAPPR